MKAVEIKVGGVYLAKVNGRVVPCKVVGIEDRPYGSSGRAYTAYHVTNTITGRKTTFRSPQKFRSKVEPNDQPKQALPFPLVQEVEQQEDCADCCEAEAGEACLGCGRVAEEVAHRPDPTLGSPAQVLKPLHSSSVLEETVGSSSASVLKPPNKEQSCRSVSQTPSQPLAPVDAAKNKVTAIKPTATVATVGGEPTRTPPANSLSAALNAHQKSNDKAPHLIVEARAGTGKTTTLVEGLRYVLGGSSTMTPSPQQKAVWAIMALSAGHAKSVCFCAFNKSIASELQTRVPQGCDAMTMHSMGFKAVMKTFGRVNVNSKRVQDIIARILAKDIWDLRKKEPVLLKATEDLVKLCKMNLTDLSGPETVEPCGPRWEALQKLASHYDVDLDRSRSQVFDLVPRVLEACKDVAKDNSINYEDMVWLPVALSLPVFRYDLLLIDEAQDLNRCQQALAKKAGKRLILCGDPKQAIYGFAGADAKSMTRMALELGASRIPEIGDNHRGCITLPLTVTRRCGRAIVAEAQKIVPDFEAHETCPAGLVDYALYPYYKDADGTLRKRAPGETYFAKPGVNDGDMILCRVNAPLVSQCFQLLKMGRKANIQGRDIGQGLISTISKQKVETIPELLTKLSTWLQAETTKEQANRHPDEAKLIALTDRVECISCFTEGCEVVDQVVQRIEQVFTDDKTKPGVRLSSIHKAKGLEANRVFFLIPPGGGCPHPMAKGQWQQEQEMHLKYVAQTRAIHELWYVS